MARFVSQSCHFVYAVTFVEIIFILAYCVCLEESCVSITLSTNVERKVNYVTVDKKGL